MMTPVVLAVESGSAEAWPWLYPVIALGTLFLGGGGIAALIKARSDRQDGIASAEVAEDDALSNRWKSIIETQTKVLLEPMKTELADLKAEVRELKEQLATTQRKYWSAVSYIRLLLMWIARHMGDDPAATQVPQAPTNLVEDI